MKTVYTFDPNNDNVLLGEQACQLCPTGEFTSHVNSTEDKPPKYEKYQNAFRAGDKWVVKEDWRNELIYNPVSKAFAICDEFYKPGWKVVPHGYMQISSELLMSFLPCVSSGYTIEDMETLVRLRHKDKNRITLKELLCSDPIPSTFNLFWLLFRPNFLTEDQAFQIATWVYNNIINPLWSRDNQEVNSSFLERLKSQHGCFLLTQLAPIMSGVDSANEDMKLYVQSSITTHKDVIVESVSKLSESLSKDSYNGIDSSKPNFDIIYQETAITINTDYNYVAHLFTILEDNWRSKLNENIEQSRLSILKYIKDQFTKL